MTSLYTYYNLGKLIGSGVKIPLSSIFSLYGSPLYHSFDRSCLYVCGRNHFVFLDKDFKNEVFQFAINPSTTSKIKGVSNIPFDYNDSLQLWLPNSIKSSLWEPKQSYIVPSISSKSLFSDRLLSNIIFEHGLNTNDSMERYYRISLDTTRYTFLEGIIRNRCNLIMLNDYNKNSLVSIDKISKKISLEQLTYFYPDYYEIKELSGDPFVKEGFFKTANILTPLNIYTYSKYGSLGSNVNLDLDDDIFHNDITTGDIQIFQ